MAIMNGKPLFLGYEANSSSYSPGLSGDIACEILLTKSRYNDGLRTSVSKVSRAYVQKRETEREREKSRSRSRAIPQRGAVSIRKIDCYTIAGQRSCKSLRYCSLLPKYDSLSDSSEKATPASRTHASAIIAHYSRHISTCAILPSEICLARLLMVSSKHSRLARRDAI